MSESLFPNAKVEKEKGEATTDDEAVVGGDYTGPMITKMKNSNRGSSSD